jgi:ribosomal-protein-alanine N-acetyltransferase
MRLRFKPLDADAARAALAWRYEGPYAFYNAEPSELEDDVRGLTDARNLYFAARDERGELIAHFCFGPEARVAGGDYDAEDALDVGCHLRPDLTGRGRGAEIIGAGLLFARERFAPRRFRATVAAFNERALRACRRAGFRPARRFKREPDGTEFVILISSQ